MTSLGNYTGPYVSDGKLQTSVEFGGAPTLNELDALSRLHDSAYAKWTDRAHREAADKLYYDAASKLPGAFPKLAANAVQYGNYAGDSASKLGQNVLTYGPVGALKFGIERLAEMNARLNGTHLAKELREVQDYYKSDPRSAVKGVGILDKDPMPAPKAKKGVPQSQNDDSGPFKVVVDRAPQGAVPPAASPQRVSADHSDSLQLPSGNWVKRKHKRKQVAPLLEPIQPHHALANLVEPVRVQHMLIPDGSVIQYNGYDPTWHINPLRRKNRVKPAPY